MCSPAPVPGRVSFIWNYPFLSPSLLFSAMNQENEYSGILEPEFKDPAFWARLVADMIHFTSFPSVFKPRPVLHSLMQLQCKQRSSSLKIPCGSSLRMRWNFGRKDKTLRGLSPAGDNLDQFTLKQWLRSSAVKGRMEMSGCCSGEAPSEQQHQSIV